MTDTDPWTVEEWPDDVPEGERAAWLERKRHFHQAERQQRRVETDDGVLRRPAQIRVGIQQLAGRVKSEAHRQHEKLKASPFWRDDYE